VSRVKPTKPTYRELQAQATAERILQAARRLFRDRGYAATTLELIAAEAGVALPTVYARFKSKRGLLEGLRGVMRREAEVTSLITAAIDEPDPDRKLELYARQVRQQMERGYDVIAIHREASRADAAAAEAHRKVLDSRARIIGRFARTLKDALAPGVSVRWATDLCWALANEELYRELVAERGWSAEGFEHWLSRTLQKQLLSPGQAPDRPAVGEKQRSPTPAH
jgi:AcrR family transcriptional regulator